MSTKVVLNRGRPLLGVLAVGGIICGLCMYAAFADQGVLPAKVASDESSGSVYGVIPSTASPGGGTRDDIKWEYYIDDGNSNNAVGWVSGGNLLWLNQFTVQEGMEVITEVSVAWGTINNPPLDATVVVYSDPNGDGDPTDGVLLSSADVVTANENTDTFNKYDVPDVQVGFPGDSFFVGASVDHPADDYPASVDTSSSARRSWLGSGPPTTPPSIDGLVDDEVPGAAGNWMVRANAIPGFPPICPNNVREGTEDCDGDDDGRCPGMCRNATCVCGGACCIPGVGECVCSDDQTLADCTTAGGAWLGAGTTCAVEGELCDCQEEGEPGYGVCDFQDVDPADPDGDGYVADDCDSNGVPDECEIPCCLVCVNTEGEEVCYDEYDDTYNGGCLAHPGSEVFGTVVSDVPICAHSGNYEHFVHCEYCEDDGDCVDPATCGPSHECIDTLGEGAVCTDEGDACGEASGKCGTTLENTRDRDVYEIITTNYGEFTWTVEAEFEALIGLVQQGTDGSGECEDSTGFVNPALTTTPCLVGYVETDIMRPGTYWWYVAAAANSDTPCGSEYLATLHFEPSLCAGDTCETAYVIPSIPFVQTHSTAGCAHDYDFDYSRCSISGGLCDPWGDPCPGGAGDICEDICADDSSGPSDSPDAVYVYTPGASKTIDISLCGSTYDTRLYVYEGTCPTSPQHACNDVGPECGGSSHSHIAGVPVVADTDYYIVVDGSYGQSGEYILRVEEQIGECDYGLGAPVAGANANQLAPGGGFHTEVAEWFILEEEATDEWPCVIDRVLFGTSHWNWGEPCEEGGVSGVCEDNPNDYGSDPAWPGAALVTIYPDTDGTVGPDGRPQVPSDGGGSHTGATHYEVFVQPEDLTWLALDAQTFWITLDVSAYNIALAKDTRYWISVIPVMPTGGGSFYQTALVTSDVTKDPVAQVFWPNPDPPDLPDWLEEAETSFAVLLFGSKGGVFPVGACCNSRFGSCDGDMTQPVCTAIPDHWWVGNESCADYVCIDYGACCELGTGVCLDTTDSYDCVLLGGAWHAGENCDDPDPFVCPPGPPNDECDGAYMVDIPSESTGDTTVSAPEPDGLLPECPDEEGAEYNPNARAEWYKVCGTGNYITASMCDTDLIPGHYDSQMFVYCSGCEGPLDCVGGNDEDCSGEADGGAGFVTWCSQTGNTYWIMVTGFSGTEYGAYVLDVTEGVRCPPQDAPECLFVECTPGGACDSNDDCDDENECSTDTCVNPGPDGTCSYEWKDCSDGDECTEDLCDPATADCYYEDVDCTDGVWCTDDTCVDGDCVNTANSARCPDGFNCGDSEGCVKAPTGACCRDDVCTVETQAHCEVDPGGGVYQGDGTDCDPNPCIPTGACCRGEVCTIETQAECEVDGVYQGDGTDCDPNPCGGCEDPCTDITDCQPVDLCKCPVDCVDECCVWEDITGRPFGDVNPVPCGDGAVEIMDVLCILDGANSTGPCYDFFIGPVGGEWRIGDIVPCLPPAGTGPDGAIEIMDVLNVLDAANNTFNCPHWCE